MDKIIKKIKDSSLLKSGIWYTSANFFLKGVNFLTIPIFTKIMTVDQYGIVNNFTAWVAIFTIIVGLNLGSSINNANFEFKESKKEFMSSVIFLGTIFFFSLLVISNLLNGILSESFSLSSWLLNFILVQSYSQFVISFLSSYLMINLKYIRNIILSLVSTILNIGLSVYLMLTVFSDKPDVGRIVGSTFGLMLLAILILCKILFEGKTLFNKIYWKFSLKMSLPVIPHSLGNIALSQFDRIIIGRYDGDYSMGLYSYIYNLSSIMNVIWSSVNNAWVPWFYAKMEKKKFAEIKNTSRIFSYGFVFLTMIVMVFTTDLAKFMAPKAYMTSIPLIVPITLAYYFNFLYSFSVNTEFYLKKTSIVGIGTVLSAILNITLNLVFVPKYGYMVAGFTNLITYVMLFVFHQLITLKIFGTKIFPLKSFGASIVLISFFSGFLYLNVYHVIIKYVVLALFLGIAFWGRNIILTNISKKN